MKYMITYHCSSLRLPRLTIMFLCPTSSVGNSNSYSGWNCRGMVSAATYSLVGVVNKFFTVLLNVFLWDKHSSTTGLFAVCICLAAGFFYQAAPMRDTGEQVSGKDVESSLPLMTKKSKNVHR